MSLKGKVKQVGRYRIKVCLYCGKELTKAQQKYCSLHSQLHGWRRNPWTKDLTDEQLIHWHKINI